MSTEPTNPSAAQAPPAAWFRRRGLLILATALLGIFAINRLRTAMADDLVPWRTDLAAALDEAAGSNRPVLVLATASWCGACQHLKAEVFADSDDARRIGADFIPVKLAHGTADAAMAELGVGGLPTLIVLAPDGQEVDRQVGYAGRDTLMNWLAGNAGPGLTTRSSNPVGLPQAGKVAP